MSDYGTVVGVAALSTVWTRQGTFYDATLTVKATNPTLATVQSWLVDVSAFLNTALKQAYFLTPINVVLSPTSHRVADAYVNSLVSDLVQAANSKGRFFTDYEVKSRLTRFAQIEVDLLDWVIARTEAFVADGVLQNPHNSIRQNIPTLYIVENE